MIQTDTSPPPPPLIDKNKKADSFVDARDAKQIGYVSSDDDGDDDETKEEGIDIQEVEKSEHDEIDVKQKKMKISGALVREKDVKVDEQAWKEAFESINSTTLRKMLIGFEQAGTAVENFLQVIGLSVVVKKVKNDIRVTARAVNDVNRKVIRTSRAASRTAKDLGNSISSLPDDFSKLASMDRTEAFSLVRIGVNPLKKPKMIGGLENKSIKDRVKTQKRKKPPNALNLATKVQSLPKQLQYDYERQVQREALRGVNLYANPRRQLPPSIDDDDDDDDDVASMERITSPLALPTNSIQNELVDSNQVLSDVNLFENKMPPVFALDGGGVNMSAVPLPYTEPYDKESLLGLVASQSVAKAMTNLNAIDIEDENNGQNGIKYDDLNDGEVTDVNINVNDNFVEEYIDVNVMREDVVPMKKFTYDNELNMIEMIKSDYVGNETQIDGRNSGRIDSFVGEREAVDMDTLYPDMDAYEILGIESDADIKTIKKAYRKAIFRWHPDRFPNDASKQLEGGLRLEVINRAWYCLNDENRRARYDEYGEEGVGTSAAMEADIIESIAIEESDLLLDVVKILISIIDVTFFLLESLLKAAVPIVSDGGKIAKERVGNAYNAKGGTKWKKLTYLTKGGK